jgi:hypothetical protein
MWTPKDIDRFWSKVRKGDGCWLWTGKPTGRGYGQFNIRGSNKGAHVWGYELQVGPVPPGLTVDHTCRVKLCVRGSHLEAVTTLENNLRYTRTITHCPHGHEYTPKNTRIDAKGARNCRACAVIRRRALRARKRAER